MKRLFILILLLVSVSCGTTKSIPVQTIEKIEYRDSIVYVNDTITIEVPKEKVVYVRPADTLSQISTSLAFSEAKVEKGILTHTLEQKGQIKTKIDTFFMVKYIDRIVEKEVPVEVEIEKPYIPTFFWIVTIYAAIITILIVLKAYFKLKKWCQHLLYLCN